MVNFTADEIRELMDSPTQIRNISVIAHVDHGKSTLTDSLIGAAGIIAKASAGDKRFMDTREDEQDRTITIKSTAVSLYFGMDVTKTHTLDMDAAKKRMELAKANEVEYVERYPLDQKKIDATGKYDFLVNLIDSPGHVDFSSEVTAALRVTDGALVVVDCVSGVSVQTETVLRQAISERIRPVLFVNKLDRIFLELHMDLEDAFQTFSRSVESVNVIIATYQDELLGDVNVDPSSGTVGFGSGLHGWGFTITVFAEMYAKKLGIKPAKMMKKLWGDNYFTGKKWTSKAKTDGKKNERGFVKFILKPIHTITESIMNDKKDVYNTLLGKLGVTIPKDAKEFTGKPLLKRVMQTWLPAEAALLEMIVNKLPSPAIAQAYRVENLYSGPMDDDAAVGIRRCDPKCGVMMYVSKMVPTSEKGRFYAFGRVFCGTIKSGQTCRIQGPDYTVGKKTDLSVKKVQRTVLMMGPNVEDMVDVPAGNILGLVGVDSYILKSGTITTIPDAHNFNTMKYSVSPVVRVSVDVVNASNLPKLMEGLKRLSKSDPLVQTFTSQTGEHIVAGAGELHLEICLKDLREEYMKGAALKINDPVVSFCETVGEQSSQSCLSKSPNKHNRITAITTPISVELVDAIDRNDIYEDQDKKQRARQMADDFDWEVNLARNIWSFGCPPDGRPNLLVENTKGVQYLSEIKDSCVGAFFQSTSAGNFCEEALRGVCMQILDVTLHADAIHRGASQIMPVMKRVLTAAMIKADPHLLEPMYMADITVPLQAVSGVYSVLNQRRGMVDQTIERPGTPLCQVKAFLPVLESFGFTQKLRQATSGQAFPQLIFSHWARMNGGMYDEGSFVNTTCLAVRKRKGLKESLPVFSDFFDKL